MDHLNVVIWPRRTISWESFLKETPENSIALDGVVSGGPQWDEKTRHINFDHHDGVVREATMSTGKQVFFAIKGGLFKAFRKCGRAYANVYINDTDQDTSLAVWLLGNYTLFEETNGVLNMNRLIELNDRLDVTGGAFPMNLRERVVRQHAWCFQPYSDFRKSGKLSGATAEELRDNLEATCARLTDFSLGQGSEVDLDTRHEVLYDSPNFKVVHEIGGNDARYFLFSRGMNAFISLVAKRIDGRKVYTIGRRSRYIPFPVPELYRTYNKVEELSPEEGWNGSDIVGGSSRKHGSKLEPLELAEYTEDYLKKRV